ncbi:MAG: hypothetical protein Q7K65_01755 [Candidatus Buchananbacteria bacterium]|nr:hypothetical protein [Candidatus Buchananbacteria bacterium]
MSPKRNQNYTCTYPEDCCPACYEAKKTAIQKELYSVSLKFAGLEQQAAKLEADFELHLKLRKSR